MNAKQAAVTLIAGLLAVLGSTGAGLAYGVFHKSITTVPESAGWFGIVLVGLCLIGIPTTVVASKKF